VGVPAPPSDYLGSATALSANVDTVVKGYVDSLVNPWGPGEMRLPDTVVVPTATFKLVANRTYTVPDNHYTTPAMLWAMHTRLSQANPDLPANDEPRFNFDHAGGGPPVSSAPVYDYNPGNIHSGLCFDSSTTDGGTIDGGSLYRGRVDWGDDFGNMQYQLASWTSAYRVLSAGIRVRVVGLPVGQFMTSGKIYFAQVRYDQADVPVSEQDFVVLERLGRASHVSAEAVRTSGSKTFFATPDGPEKFMMSSSFLPAPGQHGALAVPVVPGFTGRRFPKAGSAFPTRYYIAPYGPTATNANDTATALSASPDQLNADQTTLLVVAAFGITPGTVFEVDYAMNGEYIADKNAPAGVETAVQLPSSLAMDRIYAASAVLADLKPVMLQAAGDRTITPSASPLSPQPTGESFNSKRFGRVAEAATGALIKRRVGARAEDFWSTAMNALGGAARGFLSGGPLGAITGGISGAFGGGDDHHDEEPPIRRRPAPRRRR